MRHYTIFLQGSQLEIAGHFKRMRNMLHFECTVITAFSYVPMVYTLHFIMSIAILLY